MDTSFAMNIDRQLKLQNEMDVVANNIANSETNGFRRRVTYFQDYIDAKKNKTLSLNASGDASPISNYLDTSNGKTFVTQDPLNVAIHGDGFFVVNTPDGERYTRNGDFSLNSEGFLVTSDGYPILTTGGPLTFSEADENIVISADGTISSSEGLKGKLRFVMFDDPSSLINEGKNLLASDAAPIPSTTTRVTQGALERSNVNPVEEITRMLKINRAYELLSKNLALKQDLKEKIVSSLSQTA